jgi:predicted transglutaminase-like cysteine proteinase
MRRVVISSVTVVVTLLQANELSAQQVSAIPHARLVDRSLAFMQVYGPALAPQGFLRFCEESPEDCRANSDTKARLAVSPQRLNELDDINRRVNRLITPETDLKHYGVAEFWTLPTDGRGDCEDYALLKRHELFKLGWPSSALLITVVSDEKGEGHAVLTARTTAGDFILDNKVDDVRLWNQTPYRFLVRQSSLNPRAWVDLDPTRDVTPGPIAGVRPHS